MRVLHILPSVSATWGGPSQAIFEMCRSQNKFGVISEIATTTNLSERDFGDFANQSKSIDGIRVYFFPASNGKYRFSPALAQWLSKNADYYDVFHIHSIFNYPALISSRTALKKKIPYIIRAQGLFYRWCLTKISRWKKSIYLFIFDNKTLGKAALIHFTTEHEKDGCDLKDLKGHSYVLPLGLERKAPEMGVKGLVDIYPNLKDKRQLLFLARIHPKKGLKFFLTSVAELLKKHEEWMLVLAGGGESSHIREVEDDIKLQGLEAHVFMTGHVHGAVKAALLKSARVFVLPSYSENFGVSVVEAMQAGLPVVISDQIAIADEVLKHKAGLVFSLVSSDIRDKVEKIMEDRDLRETLGANGKRLVAEKYEWNQITPRQIRIYEDITKK